MNFIRSIDDLPAPLPVSEDRPFAAPWTFRYLRSASAPTVLIQSDTGDCFQIVDAPEWPDEGYAVTRHDKTNAVEREPRTAFAAGRRTLKRDAR